MTTQQTFFTEDEIAAATIEEDSFDNLDFIGFDLEDLDLRFLDYEEPPMLLIDPDPERTLARQKELMDTVFGGIGEEKKLEKRMGLTMQQYDIELRHGLRLLLIYEDPETLTAHLQRCLNDTEYGYGKDGINGRTIAQAMMTLTDEETTLADIVTSWLEMHREFQQAVLGGTPMSFLSSFEYTDIDLFSPFLQRLEEKRWRLGVEGEGQHKDFEGSMEEIWPRLAETYVTWLEQDNNTWLAGIKKKAGRLPDHYARAALADRSLRKYDDVLTVDGNIITLTTSPDGGEWPRTLIMYDQEGQPQLGLSRLSGHAFYEVSWDGGLHIRRFEVSSTSRNRIAFEHIEVATRFAEVIAQEFDLSCEAISPEQIEAAYLRRMKVNTVRLAGATQPIPPAIKGTPAARYIVNDINITATLLTQGDDLIYVEVSDQDEAVLITRDERRGVLVAVPVRRGRPRRGSPIMTTPLDGLNLSEPDVVRSLCAWAVWLTWSQLPKQRQAKKK
ncbi:MAG: hypothetical protein AAF485_21805 [Chloroflexota bacterium]